MEQIKAVLREELQNSLSMLKRFQQELSALPKGSIVEKVLGKQSYYYRAYREGAKVKFEYLGKLDAKELRKLKSLQSNRKEVEKSIRNLKKQIKFLEKTVHAK